ncbi:vacuolar protein sorting-associated protein VPS5 [Pseudohyphozyma bogoriensis]|nr:vacuolar protein sorting-associated protein VPS5 [Pseudohyphozyma bogoriensis]
MLTAKQDFEDVAKLTKAELARFDKEKIEDFKKAVVDYTEGMCLRQREVVSLWANYHEALLKLAGANAGPLQIEAPPAAEAST